MTQVLPTLPQAKNQAKTLRATLLENGETISHAESLERVAKSHGFRDWNTLSNRLRHQTPTNWTVGTRVSGQYLSQSFTATIVSATNTAPDWTRIALDLDTAVDVVTFDSFSALRKHVKATVGPKGHTKERTSNGVPHLQIHPL